jgi:hypothetical protein
VGVASPHQETTERPTLQQCKADIDAWLAARWNISHLPMHQIQLRIIELGACGTTYHQLLRWQEQPSDTTPGKTSDLEAIESLYDIESTDRYNSFLYRHGLTNQFYAEDDAGKR